MLPDYIISEGNVIYPKGMYLNDGHNFAIWNVIPDLVSADQHTQNEVIFLMPCVL